MTPQRFHAIVFSILLVIVIDLLFINYRLYFSPFSGVRAPNEAVQTEKTPVNPPGPSSSEATAVNNYCSEACQESLKKEVRLLEDKIAELKALPQASQTKEFYIPFGSGSSTKDSWQDISGTDTTINPANYGAIKEAYFETSLSTPTGNGRASARLYNVTTQHPVWNSEVSADKPVSTKVVSPKITLDFGNTVYRVQLLSTQSYEARLDFARVRILLE